MDLCTIVLERDVPVDARKYGPIVAPMLGVTVPEAKILVRKGRGILLEDLREEDARRLAEELVRDGVPALCARNEDLPVLPAARRTASFERFEGGLRYRDQDGLRDLPWPEIDVVSLGAVALPGFKDVFSRVRFDHLPPLHKMKDEPAVRELLRENLILRMGAAEAPAAPRKKRAPGSETFFEDFQARHADRLKVYADVVDKSRTVWLRVPMDEISYKVDENAMRLGEACGFHLLVRDLRSRCAGALTEVSRKFEPETAIAELVFMQVEDLNRYTAWHAVLHHLRVKP